MCNVILNDIGLYNVNVDNFSFHLHTNYDIFEYSDYFYKIYYNGYIGEKENHCFFRFCISFLVYKTMEDVNLHTYPYLSDILIYIIFILLDDSFFVTDHYICHNVI